MSESLTPLPDDRFLDRELSWLDFNERVLDQASDALRVPLIERAKFLAIFSSNLDEFFMVRIAGLKRRIDAGVAQPSVSGILPKELHALILERVATLVEEQSRVFQEDVRPALEAEGIKILRWAELTPAEKDTMRSVFSERIYPILTPLAVDSSHPFPYISGLSINLAVMLRNPSTGGRQFARIKVPPLLPRLMRVDEGRYLPLEEIIARHLGQLFTGMQVISHTTFRVTRNEDIEVEEDDAENLLTALEQELLRRKVGRPPVRLEVEDDIDDSMLAMLKHEVDVSDDEVFRLSAPLDLTGLFSLSDSKRDDLKFPNFLPTTHPEIARTETAAAADIFSALKRHDVLLQHPYDSFATSVQRFIEQAAEDPAVLAIKQTLYRTSGDSPIVDALIDAAEAGKQVLAIVEIKARFDEQNNISWARKLERAGVHVVYGMVGLKTHCKLALVVREEAEGLRRYGHVGTGNYNPKTARQYEDLGLLTSNPIICDDMARLFNHLSGITQERNYRRLLVAPHGLRAGIIERIEDEIANHRAGKPSGIRFKVNSVVDEAVVDALYRASQAGVSVDVWVRGICTIRPGVPGLSENIRVRSVLGRFLEHSRIYWFAGGGRPVVGIGSADLMHRNLDRRVEAVVGLSQPRHLRQITELFDLAFASDVVHWSLEDDTWTAHVVDEEGNPLRDVQGTLIQQFSRRRQR